VSQPRDSGHIVRVSAPSRLHFGLFSFGHPETRQFGGVGTMAAHPRVELCLSPAATFQTAGPGADRVAEYAHRFIQFYGLPASLPCRIDVVAAPRFHVGLGVGTQLGLAVAAALQAYHGRRQPPPAELARSVGRGLRSAVGTYGFVHGGLIVERGRAPDETFSPLDSRWEVPADWRFVLLQPRHGAGLTGLTEQQAFDSLPAVPEHITAQLLEEVRTRMLPALARARFDDFSESVYRYGRQAGLCFAACQGGPYHGHRLSELVNLVRSMGVAGVGQSSWGPTLFAILPSSAAARDFVARLRLAVPGEEIDMVLTAADNRGAAITVTPAAGG